MIAKLTTGRGARGLAEYLLGRHDHNGDERPRAEVIATGGAVTGKDVDTLSAEFGILHRLRPALGKHIAHGSMRLAPGDRHLSDAEWEQAAKMWTQAMGFEHWVAFSHRDHIHVMASRILSNGGIVSDRNDWKRSERAVRSIEQTFGLVSVASSHLLDPSRAATHRRAPSGQEIAIAERGGIPLAEVLRDILDAALVGSPIVTDFIRRLEAMGVGVIPNIATTGRLNGLAYSVDRTRFTSRTLGRGYTLSHMLKKGLDYVPDRDLEELRAAGSRAQERAADRDAGAPGPVEAGPAADRPDGGGATPSVGGGTDTDRGSGRHVDGPDAHDAAPSRGADGDRIGGGGEGAPERDGFGESGGHGETRDRGRDQSAGRGREGAAGHGPVGALDRSSNAIAGDAMASTSSGGSIEAEADDFDPGDPNAAAKAMRRWARAMKRQLAAVEAAAKQRAGTGWTMPDNTPTRHPVPPAVERLAGLAQIETSGLMRTREAITRQIDAFRACGVQHFEIVVAPPKNSGLPRERIRRFDHPTVLRSISWLRRRNMEGYDCFVRPLPQQDGLADPMAFLDDLDEAGVRAAESAGARFAVLVESSPNRFHGWIRLGTELVTQVELTAANKELARLFGGDPGAVAWRQPGRLVGLTNRKASRIVPGKGQPFAMLRRAINEVAPIGEEILAKARAALSAEKAADERRRRVAALGSEKALSDAAKAFQVARQRFQQVRQDGSPDDSKRDLSACMSLLRQGYSPQVVEAALIEGSPDLTGRGHDIQDYAERTVAKAADWVEGQRQGQSYYPKPSGGSSRWQVGAKRRQF